MRQKYSGLFFFITNMNPFLKLIEKLKTQLIIREQGRFVVCLFRVHRPTREFSLIWRRRHYRRKAANFTHDRHLWPLSSEGSLACHTYCDMGHPLNGHVRVNNGHLRGLVTFTSILPSVWQRSAFNTCFQRERVCRDWDSS